jgi:hypothetical protein
MQGLMGEIVGTISPHTEADPASLVAQELSAFGNGIGRHAYFEVEADRHAANLFVALVGMSARGRKGTSWGYVQRMYLSDRFRPDRRFQGRASSRARGTCNC